MSEQDEAGEVRANDVAIIGMAARFPGAPDVERFWENLRGGVESIADIAREALEPSPLVPASLHGRPDFVARGGVLGDGDRFDHAFFDLSAAEARRMDPQLRLFLECTHAALEGAGYDPRAYAGKIALYAGAAPNPMALARLSSMSDNPALLLEAGAASAEMMALRVAHALDLRGEVISLYTACSTSLVATHLACQSLLLRQSDIALAGGVRLALPERTGYLYQEGMVLSPDGRCRAFDARAQGTVGGNGAGVVVLKLLEDAIRDGDHVVAVIRGSAINNDGADKVSFTAPSVAGQAEVIRQALSYAEVDPASIGYVEAHGTGTPLGDPIEIAALTRAYREGAAGPAARGSCAVGSVKTNVGHLDAAAGVAGLIKAALSLAHGEIPPSLHCQTPSPQIDFGAGPFFVGTALRPFPRRGGPRRAAVSSFGIGGTNAHAVLEEAPSLPSGPCARPALLFPLSARTPEALETLSAALASHVEKHPDQPLADVAHTLAVGRRAFEHRRVVVARDEGELAGGLRARARSTAAATEAPRVAFLLPGQGAQAARMAEELYRAEPGFRRQIDEASEMARPFVGLGFDQVIAPAEHRREEASRAMARLEVALPALLAVEHALAGLLGRWGVRADAYLGHSFGEYTAACLAGVMRLPDALRAAHARGRLMGGTAPGRMLAVGMGAEELAPWLGAEVEVAAENARDRAVVTGPPEAMEALRARLAERKVASSWLPVGHAFHSRLIAPVLPELAGFMGRLPLRAPSGRYVSSHTGTWIRAEEATDPAYWAAQAREPVRFARGLDTLVADGFGIFVEVGPDQALTALARAHLGKVITAVPSQPKAGAEGAYVAALGALGALWEHGAAVDLGALGRDEQRRRVPLPHHPFAGPRFPVEMPRPALFTATEPVAGEAALPSVPALPSIAAAPAAPASTEARLAALWCELLGVDEVDVEASLLELGGDSLMAVQALTRLRDLFGVAVSLADLFEAPSVRDLAARIDARRDAKAAPEPTRAAAQRDELPALTALAPGAPRPLSYVEARCLQIEARMPGTPALNVPLFLRLRGPLDAVRLQAALDAVVARHDILRTVYQRGADGVAPVVRAHVEVPIAHHQADDAGAIEIMKGAAEAAFDVEQGPLLRAALIVVGPDDHRLALIVHHIASDTGSLIILVRELMALYAAPAHHAPPLAIQYGDYAAWQRRAIEDGALAGQTAYWRARLGSVPRLGLIADRAPPEREGLRAAVVGFELRPATASAVRQLGQGQGASPFMTMLAAYGLLLGRHAAQDAVVVGTPIGNRSRPDLLPVLGYVAHCLALRVDLHGEPSFTALLRRVRDVVSEAYEHADLPFEMLVDEIGRTRDPALVRLFDASFVFHNPTPAGQAPRAGDELGFEPFGIDTDAHFDATLGSFTLVVKDDGQGFSGELRYDPDLLEEGTARRLVARYLAVIDAALAMPDAPVGALSLLSGEDRREDAAAARRLEEREGSRAPFLLGLRRAPAAERRPMDLSLFYFAADEGAPPGEKYRLLLDGARRADKLGFSAIWTPERHFHPFGGLYPNPSVTSAALATITERIGLRAGSVVLPLHHPVRVAEEWAMIDNLSGGRAGVAIASGWHARDFVLSPGGYAARRGRMAESLAQLRALWRGEELRLPDGEGREVAVRIYPRPVQPELPVWITSGGAVETFRLAGELGASLLTNLMGQRIDDLTQKIAAYREAWAEAGHGPGRGHVTLMMHAFVGDDLDDVLRTVRDPLLAYLRTSVDVQKGFAATTQIDVGALSPRDVERALAVGFDRYVRAAGLFGTPASCRDLVDQVRRADVDEIAGLVDFGVETRAVLDGLDGLAELLRDTNARPAPAIAAPEPVVWEAAGEGDTPWLAVVDRYGHPLPWGVPGEVAVEERRTGAGRSRRRRTGRLGQRRRDGALTLLGPAHGWRASPAQVTELETARRRPPPLRRAPRDGDLPLSFAQQRLWFLDQLVPGSAVYAIPMALALEGPVDVPALVRSLGEIVARHEVLRTAFVTGEDGTPAQRILPATAIEVPVVEIGEGGAAEAARRLSELSREPFALDRPPLLRVRLFRLGERDHVLGIVMHHIVADGWSGLTLFSELAALYPAFSRGQASPLPELPVQYADYAVWQRQWLDAEVLDAEIDHWRKALAGTPPVLDLPTDRPRPPMMSYRGARRPVLVPRALVDRLTALSRARSATLFMAMVTAFGALLHRHGGQDRIAVGSPTAGRNRPELEPLLGCFVNTVVVPVDLRGDPSFRDLLGRVRRATLDVYDHMEVPFEKLVDALVPERDLSRPPLVQAVMVLNPALPSRIRLDDVAFESLPADTGTAKVDLSFELNDTPEGLRGVLEYAADLFTGETAERIVARFLTLLEAVVEAPDTPLGQLSLLADEERRFLAAWNQTAAPVAADAAVHAAFEAHARAFPDDDAVVLGPARLSYAELDRRANRLAHHLRSLGVGPEVRVAVAIERSLEWAIAQLAVWKAGGVYVPLDPAHPEARLRFMLDDCRAAVLVTRGALAEIATGARVVHLQDDAARIDAHPDTAPDASHHPEHAAYVLYTSGSTGTPKGVVVPHRAPLNLVGGLRPLLDVRRGTRLLQFTGNAFDAAVCEVLLALSSGATLFIPPDPDTALPGQRLADWMGEQAIEVAFLNPSTLTLTPEAPLPALRVLFSGAEACTAPIVDRWAVPGRRFFNAYGPTEATVLATLTTCLPGEGVPAIGRPIPNARAHVLDRHLRPTPVGVPGELYLGGPGVARGYLGRPALTAERFLPDPFATDPGARLYRTGDACRLRADGELEFLGRLDQQVKIRGFRIELGEVEAALAAHPDVRAAAAVARDDGAGHKRLVAYLVAHREPSTAAVREHLRATLPEYMLPSAFVWLDALPLTESGKVDHKALPAPDATRDRDAALVAPTGDVERAVAGAWAEVLGLPEVGARDNFFTLGGDSILAIQVIGRLKTAGLHVSARDLFEHQTVAELARVARRATAVVAEQGPVTGAVPLTPIQERFFEGDPALLHHFNQALVWRAAPSITPAIAGRALVALLEQHDALRLRYRRAADGIVQEHAEAALPLELVDLAHVAAEERPAAIAAAANALQTGLALDAGPLARAAWITLGDDGARLLLVVHHLVVDGVSWRILHEDLERAAAELLAGREPSLGPKTTSFRVWSERMHRWAAEVDLAAEIPTWRAQCARPVAPLPRDREAPLGTVGERRTLVTTLPEPETTALVRRAGAAYRTEIGDALLSALVEALDMGTLCVGLEGHGREPLFDDVDVSRTTGWFTSMFPVWLTAPERTIAERDPGALLKAIKEQVRAIPRRGVGFGWLRHAHPDASLRAALAVEPEVVWNYLGQIDMEAQGRGLFALSDDPVGENVDPRAPLREVLAVSGAVFRGQLQLAWSYSPAVHDEATIRRWADRFQASLTRIVAHATSGDAFGYTPSDFPLARLDQAALDRLVGTVRDVEAVHPLSPLQAGMLFHSLREPASPTYTVQIALAIDAPVDAAALSAAWRGVSARHAVYRTSFAWEGLPEPLAVVHREVPFTVTERDLSTLPAAEAEARWEAFLAADRHATFDLTRAPLSRVTLVRMPGGRTWMVTTAHHILTDGWSWPLVLGELDALYRGHLAGEPPALPVPTPYERYVAWLSGRDRAASEAFFRAYLAGVTAPTRLPLRRPRGDGGSEHPAITAELSEAETTALSAFAKRHGLTSNTVLLGALSILVGRYAGRSDVILGVTTAGRSAPIAGIDRMVGLFINTLPSRARWSAEDRVVPWLLRLQAEEAELRAHEATPLWDVQRWAGIERGEALFDTLLVFENFPMDDVAAARAALPISGQRTFEQTNYPLAVSVVTGLRLELRLKWDPHELGHDEVARLSGHLRTLLRDIAARPDARIADLAMLTAVEEAAIRAWNDTAAPFPEDRCVHELFAEQATRTPDAIAVEHEGARLTYAELRARGNQLAHHLRRFGVGPEMRVGLCVERSLDLVVGVLGILAAGGAYVPLDPGYPLERLAFLIEDAGAPLIVTREHIAAELPASAAVILLDASADQIAAEDTGDLDPTAAPANLAYVLYTSGSTGKPKGVMVPHRGLVSYLSWATRAYDVASGHGAPVHSSVSFDLTVTSLFAPLLAGRTVTMIPEEGEIEALARTLVDPGGHSLVKLTPSHLALLEALVPPEQAATAARAMIIGGEALTGERLAFWRRNAPAMRLVNEYGPTETVVGCCVHEAGAHSGDGPVPIGRPIANARLHVLDAALRPVPAGVPGELYVGGAGVARGYLGRPGLTAERFLPEPFTGEPGARMYRTGDLVRRDASGELTFLGRIDQQVKIRGFRVELGEIEAALAASPAVRAAVVEARTQPSATDGALRLVAYVVPAEAELDVAALRAHLRASLPDYMIPAVFVRLEALPLSPHGKVDRAALPSPEGTREIAPAHVAPRTSTERALVSILEEILDVRPIGVTDDFFDLGGHSLLAVRYLSAVKARLGATISLGALFQHATAAALAAALEKDRPAPAWSPLVTLQPEGRGSPFFCVHPAGGSVLYYAPLAQLLGRDRPFHGLEARGMEEDQMPSTNVEEMAARYLETVKDVQPEGPYLLGGHSFGALVAFEMARQLERRGERVELLALFDPGPPLDRPSDTPPALVDLAREERLPVDLEAFARLEPEEQRREIVAAGRRAGLVPADVDDARALRLLDVRVANRRAAMSYVPGPYPGKITLFCALEAGHADRATTGWAALSSHPLDVQAVPGDHNSLIAEPHVAELAARLRACLDQSAPASTSSR